MKGICLFFAGAAAQYKPNNNADRNQMRDDALHFCDKWISSSFTCKPPNGKIDKFQYRFKKVVDDAIWHLEGARRCSPKKTGSKYRKRRNDYYSFYPDSEFYSNSEYDSEYSSEYDSYEQVGVSTGKTADVAVGEAAGLYKKAPKSGGKQKEDDVQSLGAKCTQSLTNFFDHDDFISCRKHGSWTRRANGLVGQVTTMMFLCMQENMSSVELYKQLSDAHYAANAGSPFVDEY